MGANKQINELNNAAPITGSDYVALAQSGQTEATRASVSDLASAVGELNETGALSELALATSIGKNLLAQRLTEKGIATSPSETLVSMADKVASLETTDQIVMMKTKNLINSHSSESVSGSSTNAKFHYVIMRNGYTAIIVNGTIYVCPTVGEYNSLTELINSSVMSIQQTNPSSSGDWAYINCSQDCTKLVTHNFNGTADIYDVNYSNNTITYVRSCTVSRDSNYSNFLAVNNAGTLVIYYGTWDSGCTIKSTDDVASATFYQSQMYSGDNSCFFFDEEDTSGNYFYACGNGGSGNYYPGVSRFSYTYDGSAITVSRVLDIANFSNTYADPFNALLFVMNENVSISKYLYKMTMSVIDLRSNRTSNTVSFNYIVDSQRSDSPTIHSPYYSITPISDGENVVSYEIFQPRHSLVYDKITNTLSAQGEEYQVFQGLQALTGSSGSYGAGIPAWPIAFNSSRTSYITAQCSSRGNGYNITSSYSSAGSYVFVNKFISNDKPQVIGFIITDQSGSIKQAYFSTKYSTGDYDSTDYSFSLVASEALQLDTDRVVLPEDE